jgi:hypothetical protein
MQICEAENVIFCKDCKDDRVSKVSKDGSLSTSSALSGRIQNGDEQFSPPFS